MVSLTRDFEKIRKQVSRRRTHVPEWMRVVSLLFFVAAAVYLGGMYIYGTLQNDNDQTVTSSPDGGIGSSSGNVGDGPGSPAAPVPDSAASATVPAGEVTVDNDSAGNGDAAGLVPSPDADLVETLQGWAPVVICGVSQTPSEIPQPAYDTAELSVRSLFTGDYTTLVVADNAAIPDITMAGFVIYEDPLIQPGCLEATGDISYVLLFVVDPDRDGPEAARTIRTIVEHNASGARWVSY